jgi:hypothetical protein
MDKTLARLYTPDDLTDVGYPSVVPLLGCDLRGTMPETFAPTEHYTAVVPVNPPFVYRKPDDRKVLGESYGRLLESQFPGVNIDVLKLLVAAKGFSQRRPSEPPLIFINGQSGGGKTTTVLLAANLACDKLTQTHMCKDVEEFMRNVGSACGRTGYFLVDEIEKSGVSPVALSGSILGIKRGGNYRQLYAGHLPLGTLPVVILADTAIPNVLCEDRQLSRRVVLVNVGAGLNAAKDDWRKTCYGGEAGTWRASLPGLHDKAADCLVSEVLDTLMKQPTFHAAAAQLGFLTLDQMGGDVNPNADLIDVYKAACSLPDTVDGTFKGKGWKVTKKYNRDPLWETLQASCGEGSYQRLTAANWTEILDSPGVEVDIRTHGARVGVRFRTGPLKSESTKYNEAIRPDLLPDSPDNILPFPSAVPLSPMAVADAGALDPVYRSNP